MTRYYRKGFDHRTGGHYVQIYDGNFNLVKTVHTYNDAFGQPIDAMTDLPAITNEIQIIRRTDVFAGILETEPIEGIDEWVKVVGHPARTDAERDNINRNLGAPKRSAALTRAQEKYDARQRRVTFRLDEIADADLIEKLEAVPSMQAYIKDLIRKDLEKR